MGHGGTYALVIGLNNRRYLKIGKLGEPSLPPGVYVYAGSALGGLNGRLKHHLKPDKRPHWHIDYLLEQATIAEIWYSFSKERLECIWNMMVGKLPGATPIIHGFGASDCRCFSHLTHFSAIPRFSSFRQKSRQNGLPQVYRLEEPLRILHGQSL